MNVENDYSLPDPKGSLTSTVPPAAVTARVNQAMKYIPQNILHTQIFQIMIHTFSVLSPCTSGK